jgi:hypothetical protein
VREKAGGHTSGQAARRGRAQRAAGILLLLLVLMPAVLHAGTAPPVIAAPMTAPVVTATVEPLPAPAPRPADDNAMEGCIRRDDEGRFMGWMDYEHCVFSGRTISTARWFDELFGDWYDNEATMMVRAIGEVSQAEGENVATNLHLSANAALPNAQKRLRLVVTDETDGINTTGSAAGPAAGQPGTATSSQASAALRWIPFQAGHVKSDFDIGARGINPPDIFVRLRARRSWSLTDDSLARFGQVLRYGSSRKGTTISQLDFERALDDNSVARLTNVYEYDQTNSENGFQWEHGISLSHVLGPRSSLGYGFAVDGHTYPNWRGQSYGPWLLYRTSIKRSWLFYEIEPRMTWNRDRRWGSVASIVFRLEIQFGKH